MEFFVMIGFFGTLVAGLMLHDNAGSLRVIVALILAIGGLSFSVYALEGAYERGMKDASKACQFEECPYEYEVRARTERDTVLTSD